MGFEEIIGEQAHPWNQGSDVYAVPRTAITTAAFSVGSIKSTLEDMVEWYDQLFNQNLLSENSFSAMTGFMNYSGTSINGVGLGIFRLNYDSKEYWLHSGNIRGYSSYFLYDVEDKHSIAVIRNETFIDAESTAKALAKALNELLQYANIEQEQLANSINVYPNPASRFLNIKFNENLKDEAQIEIIDINGKLVLRCHSSYSQNGNTKRINLEKLSPGFYCVRIISEKYSLSKKIVIN